MSWLSDRWNQATNWVKEKTTQAANWVNDKIIQPVLKTVKDTVTAILKDPLPTIAQIAGSFIGIPPYVTSAAITAMRGGNLADVAKSAAVAYVGSKAFQSTTFGQSVGDTAASAGDFTSNLAQQYGLSTSVANALGNAAQSGLTTAVMGGVRAALTGGNVLAGMTSGFTQGAVYGGTDSYFSDVNNQKDWGISPTVAKQLAGLTSSGVNALVSGKDPAAAIGNYVTYATLNTAGSELKKAASSAWNTAKDWATKTQDSKTVYDNKQAEYDKAVADYQAKADAFNADLQKFNQARDPYLKTYQDNMDGYNKQKAIYDNTANSIEVRNAAADEMTKYANNAQAAVDEYNKFKSQEDALAVRANELNTLNANLTDPSRGLAKELKTASDTVQNNYNEYTKASTAAQQADDQYGKQVTEVATRQALLDAVNNGVIKTVDNPDAPEGSITLDNGIVITPDGKYLQDGKEIFTNASGIQQANLDVKTDSGEHIVFDNTGKRLTSETDAQKIIKDWYGIDLNVTDAQSLAGGDFGQVNEDQAKSIAEQQVADKLKSYGYKVSQERLDQFVQPNTDVLKSVEEAVDPYYVAEQEVKDFFNQMVGRDPTPEELIQFVGAKSEADTLSERQAEEARKFDALQSLFGTLPDNMLGNVDVTAPPEEDIPSLSEVVVHPSPEEDIPSLSEVVVYPTEEEPLLELPTTPITSQPVTKVTTTAPAVTTAPLTSIAPRTQMFGQAPTAAEETPAGALPTSAKGTFLTSTGQPTQMQSILSPLHEAMAQPQPFAQDFTQEQFPAYQEPAPMDNSFYSYGQDQPIDQIMAMGQYPMSQPQMAAGGLTGTRYGRYAGGGMATPLMAAGGKLRVDFRHGDAVTGAGDGQSDDIPAMLADGEFVFPADVVAAIGNGSTKAGSDKLYDMMHSIRAHVRSAKPEDLPPEIKSPLQFLKSKHKAARS